jgi:hypothetical protein
VASGHATAAAPKRHELVERGNPHVGDVLVQKLEVGFVESLI